MSTQLRKQAFLIVALIAVLICLIGCKPENGATGNDAASSSRTNLDSEAAILAVEHDPQKRPLIISQPAPNRRQWVIHALKEGYQKTGKTNPAWNSKVETAFEAFSDYSRVSTTNWPALEKALAALATTPCDDPMIQYMRVRYGTEIQSKEKTASQFMLAHNAMVRSQYHPLFKFFAGMRAADSVREAALKVDRSPRLVRVTSDLEDLARDTNAPIDEVFEPAFQWLEHTHSKEWIEFITSDLNGILERTWGQSDQWFRFQGDAEVWRAWGERGGSWATTVSEKGWEGFKEHLDKAEQYLSKAWQLNPKNAYTAYLMMQVELGQGKGRSRMETWFDRAMSLDTNYYDAVKLMSFYLEPRWYGSPKDALTFARSCVASDKWGGDVPLILANLHHSLANYYNVSNSLDYWQEPQVWLDVKSSYDKFFALNPDAVGWRHDYAKDAYYCGEYSVFLEQTKLFRGGTNYSFFGGQGEFQKMLATAAREQAK